IPVITLNQQIITGFMVQSRNWEFYTNYTFAAVGILLLHKEIFFISGNKLTEAGKRVVPVAIILLLVMSVAIQFSSYSRFSDRNLTALASAKIITQAKAGPLKEGRKILLENPAQESAILNYLGKGAD